VVQSEAWGPGVVVVVVVAVEATTSQSNPVLTVVSGLLLKRTWISELYEKLGEVE
jgi:hypothetical protein